MSNALPTPSPHPLKYMRVLLLRSHVSLSRMGASVWKKGGREIAGLAALTGLLLCGLAWTAGRCLGADLWRPVGAGRLKNANQEIGGTGSTGLFLPRSDWDTSEDAFATDCATSDGHARQWLRATTKRATARRVLADGPNGSRACRARSICLPASARLPSRPSSVG